MRLNTILLAAAISLAPTISAFAHHGWGGNVDEVTAMTGAVTEGVKLAGPHGTMKIMTSDGRFGTSRWRRRTAPLRPV